MPKKLKTIEVNGATYAALLDGKPVYVGDDGKEEGVDVNALADNLAHWQGEARAAFTARDAAKAEARKFEGIDPEKARAALDTVSKLDQKKLVDAGEIDKVRADIAKTFQEENDKLTKERDGLRDDLYGERIGGLFARSPLIVGDKATITLPPDLAQAAFGSHFKMENGKVIAYDKHGNKIISRKTETAGEPAGFDEALGIIIDAHPSKENILKGAAGQGGGGSGNRGSGAGGSVITRSQFDAMTPEQKMAHSKQPGAQVVDG